MTASIRLRSGHVKDGPPPSEAVYRAAAKRDLTALARLHAEHLRYHAAFDERYAAGVDTDLVGPYRDALHDPLTPAATPIP